MRFLIDECLHKSLLRVAHAACFEATHVNHLGLSGKADWELAERVLKEEFTFVTNNCVDFIKLFGKMELHAGLIVLVPNVGWSDGEDGRIPVARYLPKTIVDRAQVDLLFDKRSTRPNDFLFVSA